MSQLVLDASAAVRLVVPGLAVGPSVQDAVNNVDSVVVPSMYSSEVANALWKYVRAGEIPLADAKALLDNALGLPDIEQSVDHSITIEAFAEACRLNHPVYDLVYVVIARRLAVPLVTCDKRLASLAATLGIEVIGCEVA